MLCENCNKKPATVHLTKILNEKKAEHHLCEQCATQQEGVYFDTSYSINNFLTGLLDSIQDSPIKIDYIHTTKCDKCGMNYGKFKQLARLGCSQCYNAFQEKLGPLVKRIQGNEIHVGKIPRKAGSAILTKKEIKSLKVRLDEAIRKEDFEHAVLLRDEIRELESKLGD